MTNVKCPIAGFIISTALTASGLMNSASVSMPYSGLYHFYYKADLRQEIAEKCQCPIAGFIISTKKYRYLLEQ